MHIRSITDRTSEAFLLVETKPRNQYPTFVRRLLRKMLPLPLYCRWVGRHEYGSMRLWIRIAANVPPGRVILDIGAFHGDYALAAKDANPQIAVYAFEPNPITFEVLNMACENRGILVEKFAFANKNGAVSFLCSSAQSRILVESSIQQGKIIRVPAVSLDWWIMENAVVPALIKIDVEGAEASILRGARRLLGEHKPIILCEVLSDAAGSDVMSALPSNYRYYRIDENTGLIEQTRITREKWRNKNWLLIPEGKQAELGT